MGVITMGVVVASTTRPRRVSCARSWPGRLVHASILFWVRRLLCMGVTVGVGVAIAVFVVVVSTTGPRRVSCARSWPGRLVHASILVWV